MKIPLVIFSSWIGKSRYEKLFQKSESMKTKPKTKSEVVKKTLLRRKSPTSKDFLSKEPEFLTSFGKDAETIRKEVMRVKEKLKNRPLLFEQLGATGRPKFKKD